MVTGALQIEGKPVPDPHTGGDPGAEGVSVNYATGDYFRAMGIPVLEGRAIDCAYRKSYLQPGTLPAS